MADKNKKLKNKNHKRKERQTVFSVFILSSGRRGTRTGQCEVYPVLLLDSDDIETVPEMALHMISMSGL